MTSTPDRVVLAARDAWNLFVTWQLGATTRLRGLRSLGPAARGAVPALRLVRDGALVHVVPISPDATAWALAAEPDARYELEVGIATAAGDFTALVRSPAVVTPPASPSLASEVRWIDTRSPDVPVAPAWSGRRVPAVSVRLAGPRSSDHRG